MTDNNKSTELPRSPKFKTPVKRERAANAAFNLWLDRKLHEMFDSVAIEPLPEDLLKIVQRLD